VAALSLFKLSQREAQRLATCQSLCATLIYISREVQGVCTATASMPKGPLQAVTGDTGGLRLARHRLALLYQGLVYLLTRLFLRSEDSRALGVRLCEHLDKGAHFSAWWDSTFVSCHRAPTA